MVMMVMRIAERLAGGTKGKFDSVVPSGQVLLAATRNPVADTDRPRRGSEEAVGGDLRGGITQGEN